MEQDLSMMEMLDHKFVVGEYVDQKLSEKAHPHSYQVENVLDEMISIRALVSNDQNHSPHTEWVNCYSNKLVPYGVHQQLHRTKLVEQFHEKINEKR